MNASQNESSFINTYVSGVRFGEVDVSTDDSPIPITINLNDNSVGSLKIEAAKANARILAEWSKSHIVYRLRNSQSKSEWSSLDVGNVDIQEMSESEINSIKNTLSVMHKGASVILFNDYHIELGLNNSIHAAESNKIDDGLSLSI